MEERVTVLGDIFYLVNLNIDNQCGRLSATMKAVQNHKYYLPAECRDVYIGKKGFYKYVWKLADSTLNDGEHFL